MEKILYWQQGITNTKTIDEQEIGENAVEIPAYEQLKDTVKQMNTHIDRFIEVRFL